MDSEDYELGKVMCEKDIHHWHERPDPQGYVQCCRCEQPRKDDSRATGPCAERDGV
jgi:hypothetical protein